jgi:hypothetical protein
MNVFGPSTDTGGVEFWHNPERAGWLQKQGEIRPSNGPMSGLLDQIMYFVRPVLILVLHLRMQHHHKADASCAGTWFPNWRRRWFVLKDGKLFWFMDNIVTQVCLVLFSRPV